MTDDDIKNIADHLAHNIEKITLRFIESESPLTLEDFVIITVATDLNYKYNKYEIQEAFEDRRIKLLMDFFITEEDYKEYNNIH